jgi:Cof subfamily protein (haloacid dehalogenase superfamily)
MSVKSHARIEDEGALARPEGKTALPIGMTMVQPKYKMLVTDLDNTLLDEKKSIHPEDRKAIKRLIDAGYYFTIATGRGAYSTKAIHKDLGANAPAIIYNGARIVDFGSSGRVIYNKVMDRAIAIEAVRFAKELGTTVMAFAADDCVAYKKDVWVDYYERATATPCLLVGDLERYILSLPSGIEVTKLLYFSDPPQRDGFVQRLKGQFPELYAVGTTPFYSELLQSGVCKGDALRRLASFLRIDMESTVAIGDAPNDVELVLYAGLGMAVENADAIVKASADIIVKAAGCGGIAEAIMIAFGI